jgi:hypothetical protein
MKVLDGEQLRSGTKITVWFLLQKEKRERMQMVARRDGAGGD